MEGQPLPYDPLFSEDPEDRSAENSGEWCSDRSSSIQSECSPVEEAPWESEEEELSDGEFGGGDRDSSTPKRAKVSFASPTKSSNVNVGASVSFKG